MLECRNWALAAKIPACSQISDPNSFLSECRGLFAVIPFDLSHLTRASNRFAHL